MNAEQKAIEIFKAAVNAVQAIQVMPQFIQWIDEQLYIDGEKIHLNSTTKIYVIGAGKASAAMALVIEQILGDNIKAGIVTTKYHHQLPLKKINCIQAAHPVPDEQSVLAVQQTIELLNKVQPNDIVLCLLSGGASALWTDLPDGISLNELQNLFQLLLNCGANIHEMNCVRKHLSCIKGGQLLRYAPKAKWFSCIISDVPFDDITVIASGPTVLDTTTFSDAFNVLKKYNLIEQCPLSIVQYVKKGVSSLVSETIQLSQKIELSICKNILVANNQMAVNAAKEKAKSFGYILVALDEPMIGDASAMAKKIIHFANQYTGNIPAAIVLGGETTVVVKGNGKGGRNQHLALSALSELVELGNNTKHTITLLSAGTDGTDGPTDAAGAIIGKAIYKLMNDVALLQNEYLSNNDSYNFFNPINGLIKTGATQTNVMDILIVLIE